MFVVYTGCETSEEKLTTESEQAAHLLRRNPEARAQRICLGTLTVVQQVLPDGVKHEQGSELRSSKFKIRTVLSSGTNFIREADTAVRRGFIALLIVIRLVRFRRHGGVHDYD